MDKNIKIFLKGEDKTSSVQKYEFVGSKCRVTFSSGKSFNYNANNVEIVESSLNGQSASDCFEYLKDLAGEVGLTTIVDEGTEINFLKQNYSKIDFVDPDSIFSEFLNGKLLTDIRRDNYSFQDVIYPFGFNLSQKAAVDNALNNRLSIVEGPPGTGKTQTILNMLGNIILRGESVAVVSSNNSAIKNVFDKLEKDNVDFIVASLGSRENKKGFIKSQEALPSMSDWELSKDKVDELKKSLRDRHEELKVKLQSKIELSNLRQELAQVEIENKHFQKFLDSQKVSLDSSPINSLKSSSDALDAWLTCENYRSGSWLVAFIKYIFAILTGRKSKELFVYKKLKEYSQEYLVQAFQYQFYHLKKSELNKAISKITKDLASYRFDEQMSKYSKDSMKVFKAELAYRYGSGERTEYKLDDLWKNSNEFIKDYPIILSTAYSLRTTVSSKVHYDYLIIDESSQVDLCTGALALSCAENIVVVGDLKQLPHVVDSKMAKLTDEIFNKHDLPEYYRYKGQSLLSSLVSMFPEAPRVVLREHYRCSPKIIEFCNKKFYDDQLIIMTEAKDDREPMIVYKTAEGNHERNRMNQRQIDMIKEEIIPQQSLKLDDGSLGIVTPFRNQTNQLQKAFDGMDVKADTVDKFQGRENSVIILSTVNDDISKFTDNANRLNVAISRAIDQLIVVVNDKDSLKDTNIGELVRYIEYNNLTIIESKVHSVFDYLYKSYSKKRQEFLSKSKRISEFDSENLMNVLIRDVLKEERFGKLSVSNHIPLRMIIKDKDLLTEREAQYASNFLSHVDFLIYDKMGKAPVLAIEVDGVAYHKEGSKQAERDELKNHIFSKYSIPLLRFRTDGSSERQKLVEMLNKVTN
ncbi:MAG: DUF2726 domain-containing protein [Bacteriovoracaceae bacterium]|nr:DUF2726 domain-containing protein [Bacteriovoracaceae bacterium]